MKNEIPVGAKWKAEANHMIGEIWLKQRDMGIEVWQWSCCFEDGSGFRFNWGTSKGMVREECAVAMSQGSEKIVFKRMLP